MRPQPEKLLTRSAQVSGVEVRDRIGCELVGEVLRTGGEVRLRVGGTSMLPAIWPGDVLLVSSAFEAPLTVGRIVFFLRDGRLFAHRMVGRNGEQPITRGDAVDDCDPPVSASELLGVVVGIIGNDDSVRVLPPAPPLGHRMVGFAVRHWRLVCRAVLKWHSLSTGISRNHCGRRVPQRQWSQQNHDTWRSEPRELETGKFT